MIVTVFFEDCNPYSERLGFLNVTLWASFPCPSGLVTAGCGGFSAIIICEKYHYRAYFTTAQPKTYRFTNANERNVSFFAETDWNHLFDLCAPHASMIARRWHRLALGLWIRITLSLQSADRSDTVNNPVNFFGSK